MRLFITTLFSIFSFTILAQVPTNTFSKDFINALAKENPKSPSEKFIHEYELIKQGNEYFVGVLALVHPNIINQADLTELNIINNTKLENLWTFRVPLSSFHPFLNMNGLQYIEIGEPVDPYLADAVPSARVDSVHQGLGGLLQGYSGKGVIVAIIDWGFDYTHPVFYDTSYTFLRISKAWDQNKLSGPAPAGYNFGTEYIGKEQLLQAGSDTNYVFGYTSHGTHVGGIAGGMGAETPHGGAAWESELIFISLKRDAPSLIDAFSYITNYAAAAGKPYVVNMSFGSHLGPHDGSSLKNLGIDILHGPGKIFVGSAGNNGTPSANFHLDYDFIDNPSDTIRSVVGFGNVANMFGQTLSMWGSPFSSFEVSLVVADNANNVLYQTPFYNSLLQPGFVDTILYGPNSDSLIIRIQSIAQDFLSNKPNIRLEVRRTNGNHKVILRATSNDSHLHVWNNIRLNNRYTNWGIALTQGFPQTIAGDNFYGLGEPGGVGKNVITVGSYRAERLLSNGSYTFGQISNFSSFGPTTDDRIKPDISSTGGNVISSINSFDISESGFITTVEYEGKTYGFKAYSGTSMSGPMVAGIVALMLEANPILSASQAKEILKVTARLDQHTGTIDYATGHLQWGWGKANALAAVKAAETLASVPEIALNENLFDLFPNPATDVVHLRLIDNNSKLEDITIFGLDGKTINAEVNHQGNEAFINLTSIPAGTYVVRVQSNNSFSMRKFIKN
jgi:minor extracellular serine protease Vpr